MSTEERDEDGYMLEELEDASRRRARHAPSDWTRRCPACHEIDTLVLSQTSVLQCSACHLTLVPPSDRSEEPRWPSVDVHPYYHPRWDSDARLLGEWDAYSGPGPRGGLVAEWGTSTRREDGGPPPMRGEENPPHVLEAARRGRRDDLLDLGVRDKLSGIDALRGAIEAVRKDVRTEAPWTKCKVARKFADACVLFCTNALRLRGIEYPPQKRGRGAGDEDEDFVGGLDPVHPHIERPQAAHHVRRLDGSLDLLEHRPVAFTGLRNAVAALDYTTSIGRLNPRLGGVRTKGRIPRGMVLGQISVAPTFSGSGRAPGEEQLIDQIDAWSVVAKVRLGVRIEIRDGAPVQVSAGNQLTPYDLELLRLVECGAKGEPMKLAEAVIELKRRGGPELTIKQASHKLQVIRGMLAEGFVERGMIPVMRPRKARPAPAATRPKRTRRPKFDPWAAPETQAGA
jgi:hypothetical protein